MLTLTPSAFRGLIAAMSIFILISIAMLTALLTFDTMMEKLIQKQTQIRNGSAIFSSWLSPTVPVFMKIYLYNKTEFKDGILTVKEVGPFVYREVRKKVNLNWGEEEPANTVSFGQTVTYHFEPELSFAPAENVSLVIPNLVMLGAYATAKSLSLPPFVYSMFLKENIFWTTQTVHDILWGYEEPFLEFMKNYVSSMETRVGLLYGKNGTVSNNFTILTGINGSEYLGRIISYNDKSELSYWPSKFANMINGTDGTLASPGLTKSTNLSFFSPDLCRSFTSSFVGASGAINMPEMTLYNFSVSSYETGNVSVNPNNIGFCKEDDNFELSCAPDGLLDLSVCRKVKDTGLPFYASAPHFLGASEEVTRRLKGIPPTDPVNDKTVLRIEPISGIVLEAYKRLQINVKLDFENFMDDEQPLYVPVMSLEEYAVADRATVEKLYKMVYSLPHLIRSVIYFLLGLSMLVVFIFAILLLVFRRRCRDQAGEHVLGVLVKSEKEKNDLVNDQNVFREEHAKASVENKC